MIDHVLGRPSVTLRKYQVFAVVAFWSAYLLKGNRHGPPGFRSVSGPLSKRLTAWQTAVITILWLYVSRNFGKIFGLECPEPLANLYNRSYFRATYVTTALDAGFWSAMRIRRKWARDIFSVVFSLYYMVCAEQADEKVRKIRSVLTVDHLRVSWNKSLTPYLSFLTRMMRPRFMRYKPRAIRIPRPPGSPYDEPVQGWLYFDGPVSSLKKCNKVVLHIPGGGFVAMSPRTHDDALLAWAGKTGLPVLSLDYIKAPEFPYPYALNECYDVYETLISSRGRCLGLSGECVPQVVLSGDSAGGNLATSLLLMILQVGSTDTRRWIGEKALPVPAGLVLMYPALDMNIGNWMTDEQMALIRDRRSRTTNKRVLRHKSQDFRKLAPTTPLPVDEGNDSDSSPSRQSGNANALTKKDADLQPASSDTTMKPPSAPDADAVIQLPEITRTRLATPSLLSYVNDRILTPEMMRAMIILYIGPHNRPDFTTEFLLSPVLAPDFLLARFPKTYFLTGERDPLVDDTVIMAGRIRAAKAAAFQDRKELGVLDARERRRGFDDHDWVAVGLVDGVSHGFLQFAGIWPEAWKYIHRVGRWYIECFEDEDRRLARERMATAVRAASGADGGARHHRRSDTAMSSDGEDRPLEMSSIRKPSPTKNGARSPEEEPPTEPPTPMVMQGAARVESTTSTFDGSVPPTPMAAADGFARDHPLGRKRSRESYRQEGNKSSVSLASEVDLLSRRMKGLVGGLTMSHVPDT